MSSIELLVFIIFSSVFTYILVPINIRFSKKNNLIDFPNERGIHKKEIPLAGGLSFAIPVIILQIFSSLKYYVYVLDNDIGSQILKLAFGSLAILILGFFDDKRKFTANYKLLFQTLIAIGMYFSGFKMTLLTNPFGPQISLGIFSFPFTIIWFLVVINAFNLIDGIDGLAAGIAVIVASVLLFVGFVYSNTIVILLSLPLVFCNLVFLYYNFYPAKIFMGDTGALFLGFNIAAISVAGSSQYKSITTMTLLIPIIVLIIPISDTILTIFRRIKRRKHIFQADKEHLHHKMLNLGFSQKTIALIGYFITFMFGLIAFGFSFASKEILIGILVLLMALLLFFILILYKRSLK